MNGFWNQYQQNQVNSSSPEQILIMLYDGAIRFTAQGIEALANSDRVRKAEAISKAIAIITTLSDTLDHQIGGEIAEDLDALYNFMLQNLIQANLKNDPGPLEIVERLLRDLRSAWSEAIDIQRQEASTQEAQAAAAQAQQAAL